MPRLLLFSTLKLPMEALRLATSMAEKRTTVPAVMTAAPVFHWNEDSLLPRVVALLAVPSEKKILVLAARSTKVTRDQPSSSALNDVNARSPVLRAWADSAVARTGRANRVFFSMGAPMGLRHAGCSAGRVR